jgi:hypothetical protein
MLKSGGVPKRYNKLYSKELQITHSLADALRPCESELADLLRLVLVLHEIVLQQFALEKA